MTHRPGRNRITRRPAVPWRSGINVSPAIAGAKKAVRSRYVFFRSCAPVPLALTAWSDDYIHLPLPEHCLQVQGYLPEQTSDDDGFYQAVTCLVCRRVHLVNPATGKVLGEDD
jgi:hypothetical protein